MSRPPMSVKIRRALVSVSDKTGLARFGQFLAERSVEILSTGGTAKALGEAGVPVTEVSDHTGFPEIMDGRVKTLHPVIHAGFLGVRGNADHEAVMETHAIAPIDLLAVNLYPFERTVARGMQGGADLATAIETIDIGGPALIRAAAKNHDRVTVVVDPDDYEGVIDEIKAGDGATSLEFRRRLAAAAYARTAAYDAAIATWFNGVLGEPFPGRVAFAGRLARRLRYGENPHQDAALYVGGEARPGVAAAEQIQGKELIPIRHL